MKLYQKVLILLVLGLMTACGPSTKLQKSWTDPSVTKSTVKPFEKILIVAAFKDDASKRTAEDKIAAQIKNATPVQSYNYLKATETNQMEVEERLKKDGFDGVIMMRLKAVEKTSSYTPGTYYGGWYGVRYGSPGYVNVDKEFIVETNIYSITQSKLLWSGTTSTLNPSKFDQTIDAIIGTIKFELQRKGLIK